MRLNTTNTQLCRCTAPPCQHDSHPSLLMPSTTQAKFRHFDRIDAAKFAELWALQQEEATALTKQLLQADRVIHEQQLGWSWVPPDDSIFTSPHDLMPVATTTAAAGAAGTSNGDASHGSSGGSNGSSSSSGADKVVGRPSEVAGRADEADGEGEPRSGGAAGAAESSEAGTAASAKQHTDEVGQFLQCLVIMSGDIASMLLAGGHGTCQGLHSLQGMQ